MATTAYVFNEGAITNEYLQGLVGGSAWDNANPITFYLAFSDFNNNGTNDWLEDGAGDAIRLGFQLWENVANITLTEVFTLAEANLVESITDAGGGLGLHYFPDTNDNVSEGEYNQNGSGWNATGLLQGGYGFVTIIHEIGHALGIEHPHDTDLFPGIPNSSPTNTDSSATGTFNLNQGVYTTMSYNDGWATGLYTTTNDYGWQGTPMALDIAAIQLMYGANMNYQTGNDSYALSDSNGAGTFYSSIWDAGGTDEITYGGASRAFIFLGEATIDGSATGGGLISFVEGIQGGYTIAQNAVIENASGGSGSDLLDGNDSDNVLNGNAGDDTLIGRLGSDVLIGGVGNDLLIGDFDGLSQLLIVDPSLGGGISLGSGSITANQASNNASIGTAIDISGEFSLASNPNIVDSTTTPHVTIFGTGNGARDYYSFTVNNPHATIRIDMDNTSGSYDSMVAIVDANGNIMRLNDDSVATVGGGGSEADFGTVERSSDSYLEWTPYAAGTYYIVVGAFSGLDVIPVGATYELQVSIDNELGGASPYAAFFPYFDFNATGGVSDTLNGGDGDDRLYGGAGDDSLNAQEGSDQLFGGADNDRLDGGDYLDMSAAQSQVYRLYQATLDREPDAAGLNFYGDQLDAGATLESITTGFINSPEFQAAYGALNDVDFVTLLYNNVLGRAPDTAGLDFWTGELANGVSRELVVNGFSESAEFQVGTDFAAAAYFQETFQAEYLGQIYRLFQATLDREPDEGGFEFYISSLEGGATLESITTGFIGSVEFQTTYGSLNDVDFVTLLYNNVLNRAPDTAGLNFWTGELAGGASRESVVNGFSESAEFRTNTEAALEVYVRTISVWQNQLDGDVGNDILLGGRGSDTFIFDATEAGSNTVYNLQSWDTVQFEGFGYTTLNDVLVNLSQVGSNVVFDDQGVIITFVNTDISLIEADMLSFL